MVQPSQYTLTGDGLTIGYLTSGPASLPFSQPSLTYSDGRQTLTFEGAEVRVTHTEIGQLVSVTIQRTVDTGSTSFSVLIPAIELVDGRAQQTFETVGVNTVHKITPVPGPREIYEIHELEGNARVVELPLAAATGATS